jgi:hypothetical protein
LQDLEVDEVIIKIDLKEGGYEGVGRIQLAQDRSQRRAFKNTITFLKKVCSVKIMVTDNNCSKDL